MRTVRTHGKLRHVCATQKIGSQLNKVILGAGSKQAILETDRPFLGGAHGCVLGKGSRGGLGQFVEAQLPNPARWERLRSLCKIRGEDGLIRQAFLPGAALTPFQG